MRSTIHVVPFEGQWAVRLPGASAPESVHPTQKLAIESGIDLGNHTDADVIVHRPNGTFLRVIRIDGKVGFSGVLAAVDPRWYWVGAVAVGSLAAWLTYRALVRRP